MTTVTTLIACTRCQRGVKPKYAIHGLCNECVRDFIEDAWQLVNNTISGNLDTQLAISIRVEYRLFHLDKDILEEDTCARRNSTTE